MGNEISQAVKVPLQGSCCCDQRGNEELRRARLEEWDGVQRGYTAFTPIKAPVAPMSRAPPRVIGLYDDIYKIKGGLSEDGGGHSADSQNVNPNRKPAANVNKRRGQKDLGINRPNPFGLRTPIRLQDPLESRSPIQNSNKTRGITLTKTTATTASSSSSQYSNNPLSMSSNSRVSEYVSEGVLVASGHDTAPAPAPRVIRPVARWGATVTIKGAKNLPKSGLLDLSDVACCVSAFNIDAAAIQQPATTGLRHVFTPVVRGSPFSPIVVRKRAEGVFGGQDGNAGDGAVWIHPQFCTKRSERNVPGDAMSPLWGETFDIFQSSPAVQVEGSKWVKPKGEVSKEMIGDKGVLLLISLHDLGSLDEEGSTSCLGSTVLVLPPGGGSVEGMQTLKTPDGEDVMGLFEGKAGVDIGVMYEKGKGGKDPRWV